MNQKGGVGKTTTSVNIAHALSIIGQKIGRSVLAIDADPQGHLATSLGIYSDERGLDGVLRGDFSVDEAVLNARDNLDLLMSGARLNEFEGLSGAQNPNIYGLKDALMSNPKYDFVVIDCPPSCGFLGTNAMVAATEVLIPVPGDYLALVGLSSLLSALANMEKDKDIDITKKIVITRFDTRRRHAHEVLEKIQEYFPEQLLPTTISESVVLTESPSFGKTIFEYRGTSRAAAEYASLTRDLINSSKF